MPTRVLPRPIRLGDCAATKNKPRLIGGARLFVLVIAAAYAAVAVLVISTHWYMEDAGSYWGAALRLREGAPLYFTSANPFDSALYWYAPWFAALWIPLTYLPHGLVMALWGAALVAAAGYLIWPSRSWASVALSLLLLPDLLRVTSTGNVQGLMLAGIAIALRSRWGPLVIAAAASLKVFPLLFAGVYLARREWAKLGLTIGLTALLWLPALAFDLSAYPQRAGLMTPGTLAILLVVAKMLRPPQSCRSTARNR